MHIPHLEEVSGVLGHYEQPGPAQLQEWTSWVDGWVDVVWPMDAQPLAASPAMMMQVEY